MQVWYNGMNLNVEDVHVERENDFEFVKATGYVRQRLVSVRFKCVAENMDTGEVTQGKPFLKETRIALIEKYLQEIHDMNNQMNEAVALGLPVVDKTFKERIEKAGFRIYRNSAIICGHKVHLSGLQTDVISQIEAIIEDERKKANEKVDAFFAKYEVA